MKTIAILLCLICVPSAFCGIATEEGDALVTAITSFKWTWEEIASGKKKTEEINFFRGGTAENPTLLWTARWVVNGKNLLMLESVTRRGGEPFEGHKAYLRFDSTFTHFVGVDFNGNTPVEGSRKDAVDPERKPTPTKPK